jgi:hypothetical protein
MLEHFGAVGDQRKTREVIAGVGQRYPGLHNVLVKLLQQRRHHLPGGDQDIAIGYLDYPENAEQSALWRRVGTQLQPGFVDQRDIVAELVLQEVGRIGAGDQNEPDFIG